MSKHTFEIHTVDTSGADHSEHGSTAWVSARVDGKAHCIGAYVTADGKILTGDHITWHINNDLVELGLELGSEEAEELLTDWFEVAKRVGLDALHVAQSGATERIIAALRAAAGTRRPS